MSKRIQQILQELEVTPPALVWEKLSSELDSAQPWQRLSDRLRQDTAEPPPAVWANVKTALQEQDIARQLQELEVPAPAASWEMISETLDRQETKQKKLFPLWKYAAAAVVTGALVWAGLRFIPSDNPSSSPLAGNTIARDSGSVTTKEQTARENLAAILADTRPLADALEEARDDAALEASKKTLARVDATEINRKVRRAVSFTTEHFAPEEPVINPDTPSDRYFLLTTCEGQVIRISKKLADLSCCISGELRSPECAEQIRVWQKKMINAKGSHAPGNFADLLDILNALKENR